MQYLDKLLAQRKYFITAFYANKQNVVDNRNRLIAAARQLVKIQHPFFANHDVKDAIILLQQKSIPAQQKVLLLQLYAMIHKSNEEVISCLYHINSSSLIHFAPKLALCLGVVDKQLSITHSEPLLHQQLLVCFYRQQESLLNSFARENNNYFSPLTYLYIDVLTKKRTSDATLLMDFIQLEYLETELFELYIVGLEEEIVLAVVNQLSQREQYITLMLKVMALSGLSRFIPFLARYLQNSVYTLDAHYALRILLGDKLDALIPSYIQFNSDEKQRVIDLRYFGAKILHHWDENLLTSLSTKVLSGVSINQANLYSLLDVGSQAHRRVAALHLTQFPIDRVYDAAYYSEPEIIL